MTQVACHCWCNCYMGVTRTQSWGIQEVARQQGPGQQQPCTTLSTHILMTSEVAERLGCYVCWNKSGHTATSSETLLMRMRIVRTRSPTRNLVFSLLYFLAIKNFHPGVFLRVHRIYNNFLTADSQCFALPYFMYYILPCLKYFLACCLGMFKWYTWL